MNPDFSGYRDAWEQAGLRLPDGRCRHLDHLHARSVAIRQGCRYVLLTDVSGRGPNVSAGTVEKRLAGRKSGRRTPPAVIFASEVHWAKLWDLNQLRPGKLTRESPGSQRGAGQPK